MVANYVSRIFVIFNFETIIFNNSFFVSNIRKPILSSRVHTKSNWPIFWEWVIEIFQVYM
ncbi:hypothetical protein RhiirB3_38754 [Rhizophagus irregularis]|nr:hypothetical protein RhiirB3_38754 [Rhizophagus irregularis]